MEQDIELLQRIVTDYREMPGLSVTELQGVRLWGVDADRCRALLQALVARGVLRRTTSGHYVDGGSGG